MGKNKKNRVGPKMFVEEPSNATSKGCIDLGLIRVPLPEPFNAGVTKNRIKWDDVYPEELRGAMSEEDFKAMLQEVNAVFEPYFAWKLRCAFEMPSPYQAVGYGSQWSTGKLESRRMADHECGAKYWTPAVKEWMEKTFRHSEHTGGSKSPRFKKKQNDGYDKKCEECAAIMQQLTERNESMYLGPVDFGLTLPEPWTWGRPKKEYSAAWDAVAALERECFEHIDGIIAAKNKQFRDSGVTFTSPTRLEKVKLRIRVSKRTAPLVVAPVSVTPVVSGTAPSATGYCFSCGHAIPGSKFCPGCGLQTHLCAACKSPRPQEDSWSENAAKSERVTEGFIKAAGRKVR